MLQQQVGSHCRVVTQQALPSEECDAPVPYRFCLDCRQRGVNDVDLANRQCRSALNWSVDIPV